MQVTWDTNFSSPFTAANRVRQRELSPFLFSVYLGELLIQLGLARVSWSVGIMVVHRLMFADVISLYVVQKITYRLGLFQP